MNPRVRLAACSSIIALAPLIGVAQSAAPSAPLGNARCGDVVGAWSPAVGGLRARLITSGSRPDRSSLRLDIKFENLSGGWPLEIQWNGAMDSGFAHYRLDDAHGVEVTTGGAVPGGNQFEGPVREEIPAGRTVRQTLATNLFETTPNLGRILRPTTFWARSMPTDGSSRILRVRVIGEPSVGADAMTLVVDRTGAGSLRSNVPRGPRARAWVGTLDVPGVCID